jgi:hypothetical protein
MLEKTNITQEIADALLTNWVAENRQVQLFAFHGEAPALVTLWEGVLKVCRPGIYLHNSEHTINFVDTKQFREFLKTESGEQVILHLRRPSNLEQSTFNVILANQWSGDLGELPLVTGWIQ